MNILIKFPTRSRPEKFFDTLRKYEEMRATNNVHFLITIDQDDRTMHTPQAQNALRLWGNVTVGYNEGHGKIDAINSGVNQHIDRYDIVLLASDDMIPIVYGYDQIIIDKMYEHYPNLDGVLWFNDGHAGKDLNTLVCVGREYYKMFGYLYNPVYTAFWCDNEFMDIANMIGKQTYIDRVIIEHQHPIWMGRRGDKLNARDNQYYEADKAIYLERAFRNFNLPPAPLNPDTDNTAAAVSVQPDKSGTGKAGARRRSRKGADSNAVG